MVDLKFAFYGRICAIVYVLAAVIVSAWQLVTYFNSSVPLGAYTIVSGLFVGLIELPVCWCELGRLAGVVRLAPHAPPPTPPPPRRRSARASPCARFLRAASAL